MRIAKGWKDYELLDASDGKRLERWGEYYLIRPDPQIIWKTAETHPKWKSADAVYIRSVTGGGKWEFKRKIPEKLSVNWNNLITLRVTLTSFKHTGVFPEQAINWERYIDIIMRVNRPISVLNLFGYTGGATVACLIAGAKVCHVDASRGMVEQAKSNCYLSKVREKDVRFIVDDCTKFINREIRRGNKYDAVIMDPPTYGRGPNGELWRIEDNIFSFVSLCKGVLSDKPLFFSINSYTATLNPSVMEHILSIAFEGHEGQITSDEIGIPISKSERVLPCGSTATYIKDV